MRKRKGIEKVWVMITLIIVMFYIVFLLFGIKVLGIFDAKVVQVGWAGAQQALSYKLLSAPCISKSDILSTPIRFVYDSSALDAYANKALPTSCVGSFGYTYYYMMFSTSDGVYPQGTYVNNTKAEDVLNKITPLILEQVKVSVGAGKIPLGLTGVTLDLDAIIKATVFQYLYDKTLRPWHVNIVKDSSNYIGKVQVVVAG